MTAQEIARYKRLALHAKMTGNAGMASYYRSIIRKHEK
jgi:hypothetical protein